MRILLAGVAQTLGRASARQLIAAGHEVCGIDVADDPRLDPRVAVTVADLEDPVLDDLAADADVIIHLDIDASGVPGVLAVSDAAGRAGSRLLCVLPAAGDPNDYRDAEELVTSGWAPSLVIRIAPLLGRNPESMVCRTVSSLRRRGATASVRVLHTDDLVRFLTRAVGSHRTGTVDLAADEPISALHARRLLAATDIGFRHRAGWAGLDQSCRLLPLQRDWDFECGWTATAAVVDTARGLCARSHRCVEPPTRVTDPSAAEPVGEFDDVISPDFPVFIAPDDGPLAAPLRPLSLDVHSGGLGCAQRAVAEVLGLSGALGAEWTHRATAVFGQRLYAGLSVAAAASTVLPGRSADALSQAPAGGPDVVLLPGPAVAPHRRIALAAVNTRLLALAGRYGTECDALAADVATDADEDVAPAGLSDARLQVRILLLRDRIAQAWTTTALGLLIEDTLGAAPGRRHLAQWSRGLAAAASVLELSALPEEVVPGDLDGGGAGRTPIVGRLLDTARSGRTGAWQSTVGQLQRLAETADEVGRRMAAVRALADPADVHFLLCDELTAQPVDTRLRVKRRRADWDRLAALTMPTLIDGHWEPTENKAIS
ncbi:MAG: hypothetical protein U0R77_12240 [Mycolicibacterium insubricum]|nr:hypothetical protein [Mycobacterium sp.]